MIVKTYTRNKQPTQQQPKYKPLNCPSCKRNNWLEIDKGWVYQKCEFLINKQKHQIDKKSLGQDLNFSTKLSYANKNIKKKDYSMVIITTYISTKDMINKLQSL